MNKALWEDLEIQMQRISGCYAQVTHSLVGKEIVLLKISNVPGHLIMHVTNLQKILWNSFIITFQ